MYAIQFEINTECSIIDTDCPVIDIDCPLLGGVGDSCPARDIEDIKKFLYENGFNNQGTSGLWCCDLDVVRCIMIISKLNKTFTWFKDRVKYITLLRIEESCDLKQLLMEDVGSVD